MAVSRRLNKFIRTTLFCSWRPRAPGRKKSSCKSDFGMFHRYSYAAPDNMCEQPKAMAAEPEPAEEEEEEEEEEDVPWPASRVNLKLILHQEGAESCLILFDIVTLIMYWSRDI